MSLLLLDRLTSICGFHRHKRDGAVKDWRPTAWLLLRIVAAMQVPRLEPIIIKNDGTLRILGCIEAVIATYFFNIQFSTGSGANHNASSSFAASVGMR
jgi:hypothetical protein